MTYNDREALQNRMYFCEDCFRRLHYDQAGRVLFSDFRVFPYLEA